MALETNLDSATCYRCGKEYPRHKGYFYTSYGRYYKGKGYLPYCKDCVDSIYQKNLIQCNFSKDAVRQTCRMLNLYWNEELYDLIEKKSTAQNRMVQYLAKLNQNQYAGKSFDDTLEEAGTLWSFAKFNNLQEPPSSVAVEDPTPEEHLVKEETAQEVIDYWGIGYSDEMYRRLEQRRRRYIKMYPDDFSEESVDIGNDVLLRQICMLEVDEDGDIAKNANTINTLLGSLNKKPVQKKVDESVDNGLLNTPMGVWLYRYEYERPLPEVDESLKDQNHIKKYIFTWMGHLAKMLGIKNGYTKLYEEEIERLRVEKPEYEEEDDETLLIDSYSEDGDEE